MKWTEVPFTIFERKRLQVVRADDKQRAIIAQVQQGRGNTAEDVAMAAHVGNNKTTD